MQKKTTKGFQLSPEEKRISERLGTKEDLDPSEMLIFFRPRSEESEQGSGQKGEPEQED